MSSFSSKINSALGQFRKTQSALEKIKANITSTMEGNEVLIESLQKDNEELNAETAQIDKTLGKLSEILGEEESK